MINTNYFKIREYDIANGPGIRISLFVSGCSLHCKGCFNTSTWSFSSGKSFTEKDFLKILNCLKNPIYSGLSILGGEPFDQKDLTILERLCDFAHDCGKNVWIWSGHKLEELMKEERKRELLKKCDVLIDGPFIEEEKNLSLKWRGSRNQNIVDLSDFKESKI